MAVKLSLYVLLLLPCIGMQDSLAQDCGSGEGVELLLIPSAPLPIGNTATICVLEDNPVAGGSAVGFLMGSLTEDHLETVFGSVCVGFPLLFMAPIFPQDGTNLCWDCPLPCDSALLDMTIYMQAVGIVTADFTGENFYVLTNLVEVTFSQSDICGGQ